MNKKKGTVLITGASRGIGKATARLFALKGYQVAINYHQNKEAAQHLAEELSSISPALAIGADVSNRTDVDSMVDKVQHYFGPIDILVNNAGIAKQGLFTDFTPEQWQRMFDVNITGMFHCCQAVLPAMIHQKAGKIINLSSIWGITGASCEVPYSATKAAVIGMTKALAKELGPSGIQVNCVAPGVIDTDMNGMLDNDTIQCLKDETPLGTIGTPEDIAQTILFLASDHAKFITGQVISPNGGFVI
ncbi:SDR family oxidoreductase [[Clostridium] leptum]|nr:SDR family oxidoreductase [[Clostridium] leptum]